MKRIPAVIIFIMSGLLPVFGQTFSLIGRVVHEGIPIVGATVEIKKMGKQVITDSAGRFRLDFTKEGRYIIGISMIGFEPFTETVNICDDCDKEKTFGLTQFVSTLDGVVVSGTLKAIQRKESPIPVEVYTPQFLKKNPVPSIFEALQNVNGVRPQLNCNVCNTGDIHINGLEGPYTMITIDGMPIVSSLASVYGLFGIPSQMIDRIEIVKGPASGLYGSEAIGGLINIITKSPDKSPLFILNTMTTSWREHSLDAGVKFKLGEKTIDLLGVNYFNYQNPIDRNEDNFTDVTLQHRISVFNKIYFKTKDNRLASIAGRYFYEDRWGGELQWNKGFRGTDSIYGESIYTNRWELIGNYQLPINEKILFAFSATGHDQNSYYGTLPYSGKQHIFFSQLTFDKNISGKLNALLGLSGRYNYYDDNSTATFDTLMQINRPDRFFLPGIFLQNEWRPSSKQHILFGLRYDHHPVHKNILTPRLAWKWSLNETNVLRLNTGTGFRVVNLFTEEHAALTGARAVEVTESLRPERSYNMNVNYSTQLKSRTTKINFDIAAWYTFFHNQIIPDYTTDPNKIIYANLRGHSVSKGVTINAEGQLGKRMKLLAGITLQDISKYEKDSLGKLLKQDILLTEKWSGTWALTYSIPAVGLTIDYTGNVFGPMKLPLLSSSDPRQPVSPVWSIQNIQFSKIFAGGIELYSGIKNMLNWTPARNNPFLIARAHDPFDKKVEYGANGSVIPTAENPYALSFDPTYMYAPNQGIRFFTGARMTIKGKSNSLL